MKVLKKILQILIMVLLCIFIGSCKPFKSFQLENKCGNKPILVTLNKPFKSKNYKIFTIEFLTGFNKNKVKVYTNDSLVFNQILTTQFSTSNAGGVVIETSEPKKIKIIIDEDCLSFELDNNYSFYNLHQDSERFYLEKKHQFTLSE